MSDWNLKLNQGLGQLSFGMSQIDVSQLNSIYGENPVVKEYGNSADSFVGDLGPFADLFTDEELADSVALEQKFDAETAGLIGEVREKPYILNLEYSAGVLSSIGLRDDCTVVHHMEAHVFTEDPKMILQYFQSLNGGAKYREADVIFDRIGLLLSGLYYQGPKGAWRFFSKRDEFFEGRFVTIFAPSEIDRYLTADFVEVDFFQK